MPRELVFSALEMVEAFKLPIGLLSYEWAEGEVLDFREERRSKKNKSPRAEFDVLKSEKRRKARTKASETYGNLIYRERYP